MGYGWRLFLGLVSLMTLGTAGCFIGFYAGTTINPSWAPGQAAFMFAGGVAGFAVSEYISDKLLFT